MRAISAFFDFFDFLLNFSTIFSIKMQGNYIDFIAAGTGTFFRYFSHFSAKLPFLAIISALKRPAPLPTASNRSHDNP